MSKKVAIILSGCGHIDGSEIRESVFTILALSKRNAQMTFFAPDIEFNEINHLTGLETGKTRNSLIESARLARGEVRNITEAKSSDFDALIIPGGFGAAKTLCDFAVNGQNATVLKELKDLIHDFRADGKSIGAICIAPVILALLFGKQKVKITIGNDQEISNKIIQTGAEHINSVVTSACIDRDLKIVTTPAYMFHQASPFNIFAGIDLCVEEVLAF